MGTLKTYNKVSKKKQNIRKGFTKKKKNNLQKKKTLQYGGDNGVKQQHNKNKFGSKLKVYFKSAAKRSMKLSPRVIFRAALKKHLMKKEKEKEKEKEKNIVTGIGPQNVTITPINIKNISGPTLTSMTVRPETLISLPIARNKFKHKVITAAQRNMILHALYPNVSLNNESTTNAEHSEQLRAKAEYNTLHPNQLNLGLRVLQAERNRKTLKNPYRLLFGNNNQLYRPPNYSGYNPNNSSTELSDPLSSFRTINSANTYSMNLLPNTNHNSNNNNNYSYTNL